MALRMVGLSFSKSGGYVARKGIPKDVRGDYSKLYGVGWEERFTLSGEFSRAVAKAKHGEWLAEIETRIEKLRAHRTGAASLLRIFRQGRWRGKPTRSAPVLSWLAAITTKR